MIFESRSTCFGLKTRGLRGEDAPRGVAAGGLRPLAPRERGRRPRGLLRPRAGLWTVHFCHLPTQRGGRVFYTTCPRAPRGQRNSDAGLLSLVLPRGRLRARGPRGLAGVSTEAAKPQAVNEKSGRGKCRSEQQGNKSEPGITTSKVHSKGNTKHHFLKHYNSE